MHIGKTIAGNLLTGSLGRIIAALTPILLVPLMIRSWGLHAYGEWLILTAIPGYIMFAPDFGLAGAVVNQMARSTAEGKRHEAVCLYRTSWLFLTVMAVSFVLIGRTVATHLNWRPFGVTLLSKGTAAAIISWSCVQIFIGQQAYLVSGIYRSARRNPRGSLLGSFGGALYLIVGSVTLVFGGDMVTYLCAFTAARAAFLGVLLLDARRIMPDFTLSLEGVSIRAVRPYIVPGLGHAAMPLINGLQNDGLLLVLGAILGPVSVAVFQTTRTVANGVKSLAGLLAYAVVVEIPALVGEGRMAAVRRLLVMNTQIGLAGALGCLTVLGLFGEPIFHFWLRSRVVYSAPLLILILLSMFPFVIANSFTVVLLATNQIHRAVLPLLLAGAISVATTAAGCRFIGLNAAAVGLCIYETLCLFFVCSVAARQTTVQVRATAIAVFSAQSVCAAYRSAVSAWRAVPTV